MNKADLIDRIASGCGMSKTQASSAIDTTVDSITSALNYEGFRSQAPLSRWNREQLPGNCKLDPLARNGVHALNCSSS